MTLLTIQQRLNTLLPALQSPPLLGNQGIGNEIGFYIFDYDPEHEPSVQQHIPKLQSKLESPTSSLKVVEINLHNAVLGILAERRVLQKAFALEASNGNAALYKSIKLMVRPEQVVDYIQKQLQGNERLIFLTGVGACYPISRAHTILNNLHPVLDRTPLVMFFPGSYDGHELRLFNTLKDDNYYRAFPLVPRQDYLV